VFDDGAYWVLYSAVGNPSLIAGAAQGTATFGTGTFTSSNGRDFNLEGLGVSSASVNGTFATKDTLNGTILYSGGTVVTFNAVYDATFEQAPLLSAVAGTFTGTVASSAAVGQAATTTIAATGTLSGSAGGCGFIGQLTPRTDGNAFNGSITFGPAPCFFAGQTFSGIAFYDAATRRLYAAAPNLARTDGVLFVGTKP
jgi:hypothetical protein